MEEWDADFADAPGLTLMEFVKAGTHRKLFHYRNGKPKFEAMPRWSQMCRSDLRFAVSCESDESGGGAIPVLMS